ncbi:hypothetical protein Taro_029859 [Colocasia esculenta]|uniref:Uncharacterized protein n=1 Tax=Colocasia esculenta TaxID=4460 RepID=A0A843VK00_COLES|nr:hypothetical protein [Colocasia esculenta]
MKTRRRARVRPERDPQACRDTDDCRVGHPRLDTNTSPSQDALVASHPTTPDGSRETGLNTLHQTLGDEFTFYWGRVEEFLAAGEQEIAHTKPFFFPFSSAATCTDRPLEVDQRLWFVGRICPVWESTEGWFSCWRLKKSTSRDVDVDLFREEFAWRYVMLSFTSWLAAVDAAVYLQLCSQHAVCFPFRGLRATLRLDDWRVGGPQPVSRDVECDSVLAVEPARFQFSQCAPEGVAHYATGSCVLYRLCSCAAFEAVEPCLSGAGLAWLLVYIYLYVLLRHSFLTFSSFGSWVSGSGFGLLVGYW